MLLSESRENQLKYRKTRLVIVLIVCALAIIQIVCACTTSIRSVLENGATISDYYEFQNITGHDWFSDDELGNTARANFFAGFSLHIIMPIIVIIVTILLYVKKKRQIFFLPLIQIIPAILLEMKKFENGVSVKLVSIWVSASKYALSVGIISTALLLFYDLLPLLSPMLEKVVGKGIKIIKKRQSQKLENLSLNGGEKVKLRAVDRCAIVVILLCVGQIIFALTGKIGFANNVKYAIEPDVYKSIIDWGQSFWTIMEWSKNPEIWLQVWTVPKATILLVSFLVIAIVLIIAWIIAIKRKKVNFTYLLLPLLNLAPIIFESNYHSAYYSVAPCQIYSLLIMVVEIALVLYLLIKQRETKNIRLAIVIIVCSLAVIQILCACIGTIIGGIYFQDYIDSILNGELMRKAGIARITFYASVPLHIVVPIIVSMIVLVLHVKKKKQIFVLPLLQILPAILLAISYTNEMKPYMVSLHLWGSANKYALILGIVETLLLLVYNIIVFRPPILDKIADKSVKIVKNTQDTVQQKKRARAIKNIAQMERLIEEEIARTGKTREELLEEALKQKK